MPQDSGEDTPREAVELFASLVGGLGPDATVDIEAWVAAHPEHGSELRSLHADWRKALDWVGDLEPRAAASPPSVESLLRPLRRAPDDATRSYEVVDEIARGAMGSVQRVWEPSLRRHLAMKVILDPSPGSSAGSAPQRVARFLEEAQITGQLDHPGIVPVHRLGVDESGRAYFTMRLVRGATLHEVFAHARERRDGWTTTRVLGVILKVCEAMAYAHSKGVIHRDLKPSNVMVGRFGEALVMDWGLARILGDAETKDIRIRRERATDTVEVRSGRRESREDSASSPLVTMDGDVVGTPAYMPPEQADGRIEELGPRSDVYSVGALLYHLLAGRAPFDTPGRRLSAYAVLARLAEGPPQALATLAPKAPPELVAITEKAMARQASARYADMVELAEDLRAYLEGRVVRAHQTGAWVELRKWVARNRRLAATVGAAGVLLFGGSLVASYLLAEKETDLALARSSAAASAQRAADEEQARELLSYVTSIGDADGALHARDVAAAREHLLAAPLDRRGWEWRYLAGRIDGSRATLRGLPDDVWCVGVDRHGTRAAGYGLDGVVRTFDLATGRALSTLAVPLASWPYRIAFDADLSRAAAPVRSADGARWEVAVWDLASGERILSRPLAEGGAEGGAGSARPVEAAWARELSWSDLATEDARGRPAPLASGRGLALVRVVAAGEPARWPGVQPLARAYSDIAYVLLVVGQLSRAERASVAQGVPEGVRVAFLAGTGGPPPSTVLLGATGRPRALFAADASEREIAAALVELAPPPLALSPDGARLAIAANDVELVEVEGGARARALAGTTIGFVSVAFDPLGARVAAVDRASALLVWNVDDGTAAAPPLAEPPSVGPVLALDPGGARAATYSSRNEIFVWDVERARLAQKLVGHTDWINSLAFHPAGESLISAGRDASLRVWNLATGLGTEPLLGHRASVVAAVSADGEVLLSGSEDRTIKVWDVPEIAPELPRQAQTGDFRMLGTPAGDRLAIRRMDGAIELWDAARGARLHTLPSEGDAPRWGALRPDGHLLAVSLAGGTIGLFEFETGKPAGVLEGHAATISDLVWDPSGEVLASASMDGTVRLWSFAGGPGQALVLTVGSDPVRALAFDPTGRTLWTGGEDGRARAWRVADGRLERELPPADGALWSVLPLADGARLATLSGDGDVRYELDLWDTGAERPSARRLGSFTGWGRPGIVAGARGSRFALSKVKSSGIPIFDAQSGARLLTLRGDLGGNYGLVGFTGPDGDCLLAYSAYGRLVRFDATRGRSLERQCELGPRAEALVAQTFQEYPYREAAIEQLCADGTLDRDLRVAALERCDDDPRSLRRVVAELERELSSSAPAAQTVEAGLRLAQRLVELEPADASVRRVLGCAYARAGQPERALALLEPSGDPRELGHPSAAAFAALAHLGLADRGRAAAALARAEELLTDGWNAILFGGHQVLDEVRSCLAPGAQR